MNITVQHDSDKKLFYTINDGWVSVLNYESIGGKTLDYQHTFVPQDQRHQGIASAIVEHALEFAEKEGYEVRASCPFVKGYVKEHPRFQDITRTMAR